MAGASADYVINIATEANGLEKTVAELDGLSAKLVSSGAGADVFSDAIAGVTNQLTAAKAATTAANAELALGEARYADLEKAASAASVAFEKAQKTGVVPPGVEAAYRAATGAVNDQASALRELEANALAAAATETKLGVTLKNVKDLSGATARGLRDQEAAQAKAAKSASFLSEGIEDLGKPILNLVPGLKDYTRKLGESGQAALYAVGAYAGVALAVVAVTTAFIAGTVAVAAWAIGLADANRNAGLAAEAQEALHPELVAMRDVIAQISDETGAHTDELQQWIGNLKEAKVTAEDMPGALRAVALSEAALGKGGSADFLKDIKAGKVAVDALSTSINSKLGGIVQAQMKGLNAQSGIFKRNIDSLFGGLDIEPVLNGLQRLVGLFDENTAAGSAIKVVFEGLFQPLLDSVDRAATVIEAFVLGVLIGLTKLYIQAKPAIKALTEFFGFDDPATADTMAMVTKAAEYLVPALVAMAAVFAVVVVAVGAVVGVFVAVQVAIFALLAAFVYAGGAIKDAIVGAWTAVTDYLGSIDLVSVGTAIVEGLAKGIAAAAGAPLKAITGVVSGVIDAAHSLLDINSPSKVFAAIGGSTAEGFADGVDDGAVEAESAMTRMIEPPPPQESASGAPSGGGGGKAGPNFSGATLTFTINGVPGAEEAKESFSEMLTAFLEGDAARLGNWKTT